MREPEMTGAGVREPSEWQTVAEVAAYLDHCAKVGSFYISEDFRRILYGTDEPCPDPYHDHAFGHVGCPACVTGRIKTPGLVERVCDAADKIQQSGDGGCMADRLLYALRREIGEAA